MTRALFRSALPIGVVAAVALSGCMSAELARVRRDVGRDLPGARLAEGHAVQFGRLTMALAREIVGDDEDPAVRAALRHVRGVAVGTYAVGGTVDPSGVALTRTAARLEARGWTPVVVTRDSASAAYVFARQPDGALRDLLVVALEDGELALVRVSGRLDEAVVDALAEDDGLLAPVHAALGRGGRASG